MNSFRANRFSARVAACLIVLIASSGLALGQTGGMGLNPARLEVVVLPGQETTVAFEIESAPSDVTVRGELVLSLTDWEVSEDGSVR